MTKLVSVVIASYNCEKFLRQAIQSALDQTYRNIEVHVVDDGSTDGTRQLVETFLSDGRLHYYYQANQGIYPTKNRGVRESKGDYLAFLDADDIWMPGKLERQLPLFEKSGSIGVVSSPVTLINEDGNIIPTPRLNQYRSRITDRLLVENFVPFSSTIVRRECFERLGGFDESQRYAGDYELWLRFSTAFDFEYVDEPTAYYRVWSRQVSSNYRRRFDEATQIMKRFADEHPDLIDPETVNEAWASYYASRGYCSARTPSGQVAALRDFLSALRFQPTHVVAWKELLKLPLTSLSVLRGRTP